MNSNVTYWYEGKNTRSGELLKLPRTHLVETIAGELMQQLASDEVYSREGKMYGVLLGETKCGNKQVIKAFSGLLNGNNTVEGWVPPIPGRDRIALNEACTLAKLESMKQELIALQNIPAQQQYDLLAQEFERKSHKLTLLHNQRKQDRQQQRQTLLDDAALEQLNEQSRQDGIERKLFKRERDAVLQPLKAQIETSHSQSRELKQQRKALSRQLQAQMHENFLLTNFAGESLPLTDLMPKGIPTGTGECCAPKLLYYAATIGLKPLAMAEFWWGSSSTDKVQGQFYGACTERCQPLMGFLLSGLPQHTIAINDTPLTILYEDEWLIAVNKPPKLLSVAGRYSHRNDSVVGRLGIATVHRLDYETSGILLLARDRPTHRHLSIQFQQRRVRKVYEAVLGGVVNNASGTINLPLWGDPTNRPYQKVDEQKGKPSITQYQILSTNNGCTRMEFLPLTGRSHQIRVHSADKQGLGVPILGDVLYGCQAKVNRLHLHARELCFEHPQSGKTICLQTETPF